MRVDDASLDRCAEDGARLLALGLLAEACEAAGDLAAGAGVDPLHDFRVAVRRLRSALRSFRPWLLGSVRPKDERRLKRLARATGAARDAEVQLAWLDARRRTRASGGQRAGWAFLAERLEAHARRAPDARRVAARFLRSATALRRRLERYERRVDLRGGGTPRTFRSVLAQAAGEEVAAVSRRLAAIGGADDARRVHRARIEAKRLRYLLEPLRDHAGADAAAAVERLKRLQELLGDLHDTHVLQGEVRDALAVAAPTRGRDPRPGLLALARALRERRDARHRELERDRRDGGVAALARDVGALAAALAPSRPGARPPPSAPVRSTRARRPPRPRP